MSESQRVIMADVIRAGLCATGCRPWFTARKLDFRAFMAQGLEATTLAALNDPLADRAIAAMQQRLAGEPDGQQEG